MFRAVVCRRLLCGVTIDGVCAFNRAVRLGFSQDTQQYIATLPQKDRTDIFHLAIQSPAHGVELWKQLKDPNASTSCASLILDNLPQISANLEIANDLYSQLLQKHPSAETVKLLRQLGEWFSFVSVDTLLQLYQKDKVFEQDTVLGGLCRAELTEEAVEFFKEMVNNQTVTGKSVHKIVQLCVKKNLWDTIEHIVELAETCKSPEIEHTHQTLVAIGTCHIAHPIRVRTYLEQTSPEITLPIALAALVLGEITSLTAHIRTESIATTVLCAWNSIPTMDNKLKVSADTTLALMHSLVPYSSKSPNERSLQFNSEWLIQLTRRAHQLRDFRNFLHQLGECSLIPTTATFERLFSSLHENNKSYRWFLESLQFMHEHNVEHSKYTVITILKGYGKRRKTEFLKYSKVTAGQRMVVNKVYELIVATDAPHELLESYTVQLLLECCGMYKQKQAIKHLTCIIKENSHIHLTEGLFNKLARACMDAALDTTLDDTNIFEWQERLGCYGTQYSYVLRIMAAGRQEKPEEAWKAHFEMVKHYPPNAYSCAALAGALRRANDLEGVKRLNLLMWEGGVEMTGGTAASLLIVYKMNAQLDMACKLVQELDEKGIEIEGGPQSIVDEARRMLARQREN